MDSVICHCCFNYYGYFLSCLPKIFKPFYITRCFYRYHLWRDVCCHLCANNYLRCFSYSMAFSYYVMDDLHHKTILVFHPPNRGGFYVEVPAGCHAAFGSRWRQGEYQRGHALRDADAFCPGRSEKGGYCPH